MKFRFKVIDMPLPILETQRLTLRPFDLERDIDAIIEIFGDETVNRFLPWWPVRDEAQARRFFEERLADRFDMDGSRCYAICSGEAGDDRPIGYLHIDGTGAHDLGYGLLPRFQHQGIMAEACAAALEQAQRDDIPFVTATHDVNNPASGRVMQRLGMAYRYSYVEQWQPKDFPVTFRMYQLNLADPSAAEYRAYWDAAETRFVEPEPENRADGRDPSCSIEIVRRRRMTIVEVEERTPALVKELTEVWERSVRETHAFLSEAEIQRIKRYVPQALGGVAHLIVAWKPTGAEIDDGAGNGVCASADTGVTTRYPAGRPVGFMGIENGQLEMLFLAPEERGRGLGKALIRRGIESYGLRTLAVNEQNPRARGFYEHMGFRVVRRTDHDEQGGPYPLLYMELADQGA